MRGDQNPHCVNLASRCGLAGERGSPELAAAYTLLSPVVGGLSRLSGGERLQVSAAEDPAELEIPEDGCRPYRNLQTCGGNGLATCRRHQKFAQNCIAVKDRRKL